VWVVHACLANLTVNCTPRDNAELAEYIALCFAGVFALGAFFAGLLLLGEWLDGLL
jgi:hypothetical protein